MALAVLFAIALPTPLASAKPPPPPYAVAASPASITAGSTGNAVTFQFRATRASNDPVTVVVPAVPGGEPWTAPQASNPGGAGHVAASRQTCRSARVASVTGAAGGPWTVTVNARCWRRNTFALTYSGVTAATKADQYRFTTSARIGRNTVPVVSQPTVTVVPGAAASLTLSGLGNAAAGSTQSPTVTLRDAFGNVASGYRGQVGFSSTDTQAVLPANYSFTASDAGVHTFTNELTLKAAGSRGVTAADIGAGSLRDTATVSISPGPVVGLDVTDLADGTAGVPQSPTVTARDAYGNTVPGYRGTVRLEASCESICNVSPSVAPEVPADYTFTAADAGSHTFTNGVVIKSARGWTVRATDTADSSVRGSQGFTIAPADAQMLEMTGLEDRVAGIEQSATVTLRDAFGNIATGYRGTVRIETPGGWGVSGGDVRLGGNVHTFSASDAGVRIFHLFPQPAGEQTVTATDTATSTLTASQTVTISPGPTFSIDVGVSHDSLPALVIGQTVRFEVNVVAADFWNNVTPDWNHPVHLRIYRSGLVIYDQDIVLENGRKTIEVDVKIDQINVSLSFFPTVDPSLGIENFASSFGAYGVQPDLETVRIEDPTPNPDGTLGGNVQVICCLDATIDTPIIIKPPTIGFTFGEATKNDDGTYTVPFTSQTPGGARLVGNAIVSTPVNVTTGLVAGNLVVVAAESQDIEVMGCVDLLFRTFASGTGTPPPTSPCPESFAPVDSIPPGTPWIVFGGTKQSQAAALVAVVDLRCEDITKTYNKSTDKCE